MHRSIEVDTHLLFLVDEERIETSGDGGEGHPPHEDLNRDRHDCSDLVGKKHGEHRRQRPNGHLQFPSGGGSWRRSLEPPEAGE